jgi:nucleoside-diphosphate-sugar epimerase
MENLYMYGRTNGRPIFEDTPFSPVTRKGEVRAAMARELAAAHDRGEIQVATIRASDFFGPRVLQSALGERVFGRVLQGKAAQVLGDPGLLHTYTYVGDVARALVLAGHERSMWGKAWHVPSDQTTSTGEMVAMIGELAGVPAKAQPTPKLLLRMLGWFDPEVREVTEMLYEFEEPFISGSRALQTTFGFQPTPVRPALQATIDWYRSRSGS